MNLFAFIKAALGFACLGIALSVQAAGGAPRIVISDAPTVTDNQGNQTARFEVFAIYDPVLITCPIDRPDCNARRLSFCVGFNTASGTAHANIDFLPVSGQLQQTVDVDGPDVIDIGSVEVPVLGDSIAEGTETFSVKLSNVSGCLNQGALADPVGVGTIADGAFGLPDLQVSRIALVAGCEIQLTLTNAGTGTVPESAYDRTAGATVQMFSDGLPWGGLRLLGVDPSRLLKTPGASVTTLWFPNTDNLQLAPGLHTLQATVDGNHVVPESVEGNNTRSQRVSCTLR